jgi:hypothetical protein
MMTRPATNQGHLQATFSFPTSPGGTRWHQPLRSENLVDYGQPVIMGLGPVPLNPVRVIVTTAYGISRQKPARLRELYKTWAAMNQHPKVATRGVQALGEFVNAHPPWYIQSHPLTNHEAIRAGI